MPHHDRFFDPLPDVTDDYAFCRRFREAGGRIFADVESHLTHWGGCLYAAPLDELRA